MLKKNLLVIICFLLLSLAGCSVAPINSASSARSLGTDVQQLKVNTIVPGVMYERGLAKDVDLGVAAEFQVSSLLNVYGKYSFINNAEAGISLAGLVGGGYSGGLGKSKSFYVGPILSYRYDSVEFFTAFRMNFVNWKNNITSQDRDDLSSIIPRKASFHYTQLDAGINFLGEKWWTSLGLKIFGIGQSEASGAPFFDIGYKF